MILIKRLWSHLSKKHKKQFLMLFAFMVFASFSEVISIGLILPFLGAISDASTVYDHNLMQPIIKFFNIDSPDQILLPVTIIFVSTSIIAGLIRLMLLYFTAHLSRSIGTELSVNIYRRTLYQEYAIHINQNSSDAINNIIVKTGLVIGGVIIPVANLLSSTVLIFAVTTTLLIIDTIAAITSLGVFGILYWFIIRFTHAHLVKNSECIADESSQLVKLLQEGLGGIRDVLIDGSQQFYINNYRIADVKLRRAKANNIVISGSPRFIMEALGMSLIAILAYTMSIRTDESISTIIPVLGALALGAQRLLPALQQAYSSISSIKGAQRSLHDVVKLFEKDTPKYIDKPLPIPISFEKEINLSNLGFRYSNQTPWVFKNHNIQLAKGSCVGFIGKTGSGKSTLLDVIMGLLRPTEGKISVDRQIITEENCRGWQMHIAHVPQNIFLSDGTVEENIAYGVSNKQINYHQIKKAAKQAKIDDFIESWPEKYKTIVGERGVKLSGGQRQRIGIARALYKQVDVLILDEATSALDNKTEQAVIRSIKELSGNITIMMIAHRLTTLVNCDRIIELENNNVIRFTTYEELCRGQK